MNKKIFVIFVGIILLIGVLGVFSSSIVSAKNFNVTSNENDLFQEDDSLFGEPFFVDGSFLDSDSGYNVIKGNIHK
jgi:hypothetical protein